MYYYIVQCTVLVNQTVNGIKQKNKTVSSIDNLLIFAFTKETSYNVTIYYKHIVL